MIYGNAFLLALPEPGGPSCVRRARLHAADVGLRQRPPRRGGAARSVGLVGAQHRRPQRQNGGGRGPPARPQRHGRGARVAQDSVGPWPLGRRVPFGHHLVAVPIHRRVSNDAHHHHHRRRQQQVSARWFPDVFMCQFFRAVSFFPPHYRRILCRIESESLLSVFCSKRFILLLASLYFKILSLLLRLVSPCFTRFLPSFERLMVLTSNATKWFCFEVQFQLPETFFFNTDLKNWAAS